MDDTDIQRILSEQDWDELTPRLLMYALGAIKGWRWQGAKGRWKDPKECLLPGGVGPEDLLNEAVARICAGGRRWEPQRHPDLFQYLKDVIDSLISAVMEGRFNKNERLSGVDDNNEGAVATILDFTPDPRQDIRARWESENSDFIILLHEFLADEPQLQKIVDFIIEGDAKPKELAESLGISVPEVNNLQKKLRRRVTEFRKSWNQRTASVDAGGES